MSETLQRQLFAADALLPTGWARNVLVAWDGAGRITAVTPNTQPDGAAVAPGPLLPGMPNLHSHAFQRAFAGLTEYRGESQDSFWSWRNLMYRFAARITPESLEAIATWLYVEMLEAGYTSVCEFHYVHHDQDGRPYADDATLSLALLRAAKSAGIGITLLPVLYQTSGLAPSHRARPGTLYPQHGQHALLIGAPCARCTSARGRFGPGTAFIACSAARQSGGCRAGPHGTQCASAHSHPYCRADAGGG